MKIEEIPNKLKDFKFRKIFSIVLFTLASTDLFLLTLAFGYTLESVIAGIIILYIFLVPYVSLINLKSYCNYKNTLNNTKTADNTKQEPTKNEYRGKAKRRFRHKREDKPSISTKI